MKKFICVIISMLLIAAVFSACEGKGKTEETTGEESRIDNAVKEYFEETETDKNGENTTASADTPLVRAQGTELMSSTPRLKPGDRGDVVFKGSPYLQYLPKIYNDAQEAVEFEGTDRVNSDENGVANYTFTVPEDTQPGNYLIYLRADGSMNYIQTTVTVEK